MKKSTSKTVRDILIIICIIVVAVVIREYIINQRTPTHTLETGNAAGSAMNAPHGSGGGMGEMSMGSHVAKAFPEGDDTVVATIDGLEITQMKLYKSANSAISKMGGLPEDKELTEGIKKEALMIGLAELLSDVYIENAAIEYGVDVPKLKEDAVNAWALEAGAVSPEALLEDIGMPGVTVEDMANLLTQNDIVQAVQDAIAEQEGLESQGELDAFMSSWLQDGIFKMKVDFTDEKMSMDWDNFIMSAQMGHMGGGHSASTGDAHAALTEEEHSADDGHGHE